MRVCSKLPNVTNAAGNQHKIDAQFHSQNGPEEAISTGGQRCSRRRHFIDRIGGCGGPANNTAAGDAFDVPVQAAQADAAPTSEGSGRSAGVRVAATPPPRRGRLAVPLASAGVARQRCRCSYGVSGIIQPPLSEHIHICRWREGQTGGDFGSPQFERQNVCRDLVFARFWPFATSIYIYIFWYIFMFIIC